MWIGYWNLPNAVTLLGMATALVSMLLAIQGQFALAIVGLVFSGICDLFDGYAARKVKRSAEEQAFGGQLDSLNDVVCFGVLPVLLVQSWVKTPFVFPVLAFYLGAVLMRLAYFNIHGTSETNGRACYTGLPVTSIAMILPVLSLPIQGLPPLGQTLWFALLMGATGLLFISKVSIPKPSGKAYVVFPLLAILAVIVWLIQFRVSMIHF